MPDRKLSERLRNISLCLVALLVFGLLMFPLYWMVVTSLKTEIEIFKVPPTLLPHVLNTDSYFAQMKHGDFNMFRSFKNSLVISACAMLISLEIGRAHV
jgi:multiple sugar transport system permease protein